MSLNVVFEDLLPQNVLIIFFIFYEPFEPVNVENYSWFGA